jgi:hypothetical protein
MELSRATARTSLLWGTPGPSGGGAFEGKWVSVTPRRGNPKLHEARKSAVGAVKAEADRDRYAANVLPIIREVQKAGARTLGREVLRSPPRRD